VTIVARLRAAGCVFAEDEARLIEASAGSPAELAAMVERRVAGEPLEHVVGWAEFCGLRIAVTPGVFVPRRRTEFLVETAAAGRDAKVVVDLCCGSGALGAALASRLGPVELHAADLDPAAVRCARRNVDGDRVHQGDLFAALPDHLRGRVDVLLANVPYVPTGEVALLPTEAREHEARIALDGGGDGLDVLRRVSAGAPDWLATDGRVFVEVSERQVATAVAIFTGDGLAAEVARSEDLDATVVVGRWAPPDSPVPGRPDGRTGR
jgi:release factor glutamine methyltransferase